MRVKSTSMIAIAIGLTCCSAVSLAALLGINLTGSFPNLNYVSNESSATAYTAGSQNFTVLASPVAIRFSGVTPPRLVNPTGFPPAEVVSLAIQVDNSGNLIGGVPGDDLVIQGEVDVDGNGSIDFAGILLTGEVLGFGHQDTGTASDEFDFRFQVTGGLLAAPYFAGKDIGMTLTSEESNFVGNFNVNFNGKAKGNIAPIPPINRPPVCAANGPYEVECAGGITTLTLDGTQSSDDDGDQLVYSWTSTCPGATFVNGNTASPTLSIDSSNGCAIDCEVSLTVSDGVNPPSHCQATVRVRDTNAPEIVCPGNVQIECDDSTDPADTGMAGAADTCDPNPSVTYSDSVAAGTCPVTQVITRTWRATDSCGLNSECIQTITLVDTTAPQILTCPPNVDVTCAQGTSPDVTGRPTVQDNCDANPSVTFEDQVNAGSCPIVSIITRTWTVKDACGNANSCTQVIRVSDNTAPTITCPSNVQVECGQSTDPVATGQATAQDSCDPCPAITYKDTISGTCPKIISRKWKATDNCGNSVTCTQIITVVDTTPPAINCPPDKNIMCGESTNPSNTGWATANDLCDPSPTVTYTDTVSGGCPGTITRAWTATDRCGNSISCTQIITIKLAAPCPRTPGYWKNHRSRWPVDSLQVGCVTYNATQLMNLLSNKLPNGTNAGSDMSAALAKFVIANKFNLLAGSDPQIQPVITAADQFLCSYPPGSDPKGTNRRIATDLKDELDYYANSRPAGCVGD